MTTSVDKLELLAGAGLDSPVSVTNLAEAAEYLGLKCSVANVTADLAVLREHSIKKQFEQLEAGAPRSASPIAISCSRGEVLEFEHSKETWLPGGQLLGFLLHFKQSLCAHGIVGRTADFICAALEELVSNAQEHSCGTRRSILTFEVVPKFWVFSVTDFGIGIPSSLRTASLYRRLADPDALVKAIEPGVSAKGPGRGMGFQTVLKALADRLAKLRIRSACGLLTVRGGSSHEYILQAKPHRQGTHVRVGCYIGHMGSNDD